MNRVVRNVLVVAGVDSAQRYCVSCSASRQRRQHLIGDKPLKTLRLSQDARALLLEDFRRLPRSSEPVARHWEKWLKVAQPTLPVTFDQATATESPKTAYLSVLHPFVRQAARFLRNCGT